MLKTRKERSGNRDEDKNKICKIRRYEVYRPSGCDALFSESNSQSGHRYPLFGRIQSSSGHVICCAPRRRYGESWRISGYRSKFHDLRGRNERRSKSGNGGRILDFVGSCASRWLTERNGKRSGCQISDFLFRPTGKRSMPLSD